MANKVLLTGSTGFVGAHVEQYLTSQGLEVVPTDTDLTEPLPDLGNFDYIINLASGSSVERSVADPAEFIKSNVAITLSVLEYARAHPPKVFLHFSTVEIYDVTNPYAASKAAQEEIVNAYWKTYDVPAIIARSSNIIGEGQSADKFVPKVIEQIKADKTVNIYTTPTGLEGTRVYNTVNNVASAIMFLLELYPQVRATTEDDNKVGLPIHFDIDGGTELTNLQMAQKIAGYLGKKLDYELVVPQSVRPTYARQLNPTGVKLTSIGWQPAETLEEGLSWIK